MKKGFTLVELMVILVIIAVIAAVVIPLIVSRPQTNVPSTLIIKK
jgi:prepilin-type N-terminal cleavage/methylation domain-containing protein